MRRRRRAGRARAPVWGPAVATPARPVSPAPISPPTAGAGEATAAVNREPCIGCGRCVPVCPAQAITLGADGKATVDRSLCRGCGACVRECPVGAVYMIQETKEADNRIG
jgi:ferredoxin